MKAEIIIKNHTVEVDIQIPTIEVEYHPEGPTIQVIGKVGLQGPKGDRGDPGEPVELQSSGSVIQWKYESSSSWEDLMDVEDLLDESVADVVDREISEAMARFSPVSIVSALPTENINPGALYIVKNGGIV